MPTTLGRACFVNTLHRRINFKRNCEGEIRSNSRLFQPSVLGSKIRWVPRPILDFKEFNNFVEKSKVQNANYTENTIVHVTSNAPSKFETIPLFSSRILQFLVLPFGFGTAPFVLTRVCKPLLSYFEPNR